MCGSISKAQYAELKRRLNTSQVDRPNVATGQGQLLCPNCFSVGVLTKEERSKEEKRNKDNSDNTDSEVFYMEHNDQSSSSDRGGSIKKRRCQLMRSELSAIVPMCDELYSLYHLYYEPAIFCYVLRWLATKKGKEWLLYVSAANATTDSAINSAERGSDDDAESEKILVLRKFACSYLVHLGFPQSCVLDKVKEDAKEWLENMCKHRVDYRNNGLLLRYIQIAKLLDSVIY